MQSVYSTSPANWAAEEKMKTLLVLYTECSKLAEKKYMSRYDLARKVIHYEFYKTFRFNYAMKQYMYKLGSDLWNETLNIYSDFEMQTYHLISARWLDLVKIKAVMHTYAHEKEKPPTKKKKSPQGKFDVPTPPRYKNRRTWNTLMFQENV